MSYFRRLVLPLGAAIALASCNLVTGASDLKLTRDNDGDGQGGGAAGAGAWGTGGTPSQGGSAGSQPDMALVDGVQISSIAIYQGVKRPLMENGVPASSNVSVVAGRDALVRVFYALDGSYNGQPVTARLSLGGQSPLEATQALSGVSTDASLASTINIDVPGTALESASSYRLELLQPEELASGTNAAAVYPAQGQESLTVVSTGDQLRIVLIPIRYDADGSGRLPNTTDGQLNRYRDWFYGIYPTRAVELTVSAQVGWSYTVSPGGSGWGSLLDAIVDHRQSSGAAPDEYYYGIFEPDSSFSSYCAGGCVVGLSMIAGPNDAWARASIGLGFLGESAAETAVHEVGHAHGLGHAPCSVWDGVDPSFPYSSGNIGVWGYDVVNGELHSPSMADFMSYCEPIWTSDYHFNRMFDRLRIVNNAQWHWPEQGQPTSWERIAIRPDGNAEWLEPLQLRAPPSGEPIALTVERGGEEIELSGYAYPYSHLLGGTVLLPSGETASSRATIFWQGERYAVSR